MPGRDIPFVCFVFRRLRVGSGSWGQAVALQHSLPREASERAQSLMPRRRWSGATSVDNATHVAPLLQADKAIRVWGMSSCHSWEIRDRAEQKLPSRSDVIWGATWIAPSTAVARHDSPNSQCLSPCLPFSLSCCVAGGSRSVVPLLFPFAR